MHPKVFVLLLLALVALPYVHAQFSSDAYSIRTVHVFPSVVTGDGWNNLESITFQNLEEYALFDEFNDINSATMNLSRASMYQRGKEYVDSSIETVVDQNSDLNEVVDDVVVPSAESVAGGEQSGTSTPGIESAEMYASTSAKAESQAPTEADILIVPETSVVTTTDSVSTDLSTTTVLKKVESVFALAVEAVTEFFGMETATTTVEKVVSTSTPELDLETSPTSTDSVVFGAQSEMVSTSALLLSASTSVVADVVATSATTTVQSEVSVETEPVDFVEPSQNTESASSTPCAENCGSYEIALNDFGYPLGEQVEITGAQLRLSFAAQTRTTRDAIPEFSLVYSVDGEQTWLAAGTILIDEEVSNSINGGFFLFALPEVTDQVSLNTLSVKLKYNDDPYNLSGLFVESVWLELFTIEPPEMEPLQDVAALLADDGYSDEMLSGDILQLPDGEHLRFKFTDDNTDESLVIKTTERTYEGFSEVATYFSVTNTSDEVDDITVQAYFPDGVGEVVSIEKFTQNKPRDVVVPEYRPYVYHCEAGWEYAGEVTAESLEELSQQLSLPRISAPAEILETSTSTASDNSVNQVEQVATSTEEIEVPTVEFDLPASSATTTVLRQLPGVSALLQFSTTTLIDNDNELSDVTSSSSEANSDEANLGDGEDLIEAYACRNTNVVRKCDELDGSNTACRVNQVKVAEYEVVKYAPGWVQTAIAEGAMSEPGFFKRAIQFIGFGPDVKEVPEQFEVRTHTPDTHTIQPGETLYFKMNIAFPPFSRGEYWIEAVGDSEYGLLDPFWSSEWSYRMPIRVSNPTGSDQTEYQVFFELDSALTDFWSNVNSDGSDIRFIQELPSGTFSNEGTAVNNWLDFDFTHRIPIEIPAGSVDADLTDFPISIDLSSLGSDFWTNVKSDGGDVRVYTSGGTEVAIDLAHFDSATELGELHFLASSVPAQSATTYYLYYGDSTLSGYADTDPLGSQAVWVNYNAVYHFNDDPTTVGNIIADETGNGNDLEVFSAGLATTTGQFGLAVDLTGTGSGYLSSTTWSFPGGDPLIVTGSYYMTSEQNEGLFQWGNGGAGDQIEFRPWYNTTNGLFYFGVTGGATYNTLPQATTSWHGFAVMGTTSASGENIAFEDGKEVLRVAQTIANPSNTIGFEVGREGGGSINAFIDELRVATSTRSEARIKAESIALEAPEQLYVLQPIQVPNNAANLSWYSTSWDGRIRLSIPAAKIQEDLTDFPVYLDLGTLGSSFFTSVASDGRDIRVTEGDGVTEVPIEIVEINTGAGTGEMYFKADLSTSGANDFYVYFDNSDVSAYGDDDTYGAHNVWTNGFQAVYHLSEDASGTGNPDVYLDSTANEYHGDDENSSNGKSGLFGSGQEFGDSQVDYISLPYQVMDGLTDNTVSWWHISSTSGDQTIVSGANSTQFNEFWERLDNNTTIVVYSQGAGETFTLDNPSTYNDDTWQFFMTTSQDDIDEMNLYRNGVPDNENPDPQPIVALDIEPGGLIIGQDQDALGGSFSTAENFEGILDELRFASVVRSEGWAAAVYDNMANQSSFISTSSSESLQATTFVELDYWLQYFDSTADEADIWVQVEDLPADEDAVIYLYYGNVGAPSVSDELATFSYSTSTDLYYVVDNSGVTQLSVTSLIDGNEVSLDGAAAIALDQGESTTFGSVSNTSVISALGPISGTLTGSGNDSSDSIAPISFATTTFAIPLNRSANRWYMLSPYASTTVRTYIGNSGTANQTFNITTGAGATATTDPADSGTGTDGSGVVIESTSPILVSHRSTNPGDGIVAYPPTTRDIFGVDSQYFHLSATADDPDPTVYCSNGSGGSPTGTTRGEKDDITQCTTGSEGTGSAVRFAGAATPIAAVQFADSDGNEATAFWAQHDFGTRYAMTNDSAYAAVVCSPRFASVDLEVIDSSGSTISSGTCTPGANDPGKAYFGTDGDSVVYTAGHQVISTNGVPFYVTYEDVSVEQDEKNIMGTVQGRKSSGEFASYVFGPQELAIDAEWEQLSFMWYENTAAVTPTTPWQIGTEGVTEGVAITGAGAVDNGDVLRLRLNLEASNATGSVDTNAFTLQYAAAASGQCDLVTAWFDLGEQGSTTASFSGYNNAGVADGATLPSTLLTDTTISGTYEERNYSDFLPSDVPVGDVVEYDWVIEATNVSVNTNYCFRLTRAQGSALEIYTTYPELETVGPPNVPTLLVFFDNERTTVLTPVLEFTTVDIADDDINYQVQVDDDYDFSSTVIDKNSDDNFTLFENINTPSDKAPFTSGARIRFTALTALSPTTTYYWRVRADDPNGSATSSAWSTPFSFTTDTTLTVSEWFQTTDEQFNTNTNSGVTIGSDQVAVSASPGTVVSTAIDFDDATLGNAWGELDWNDTETSGSITYQIEYNNNGSWTLVPDSVLPDNSTGTSTGPISLLDLDTSTYNEIRVVATLTGTTLSIQDWVVRWGLRVETPTQGDPFDNQKVPTTTPVFDFVSSDPQGDDLEYEISFSTDIDFVAASTTYNSSTSPQFANTLDGGDTSPFTTDQTITFSTPFGTPFTNGATYWWRTRAKDPNGGDSWSPWSQPDSFTVDTAVTLSTWYQTTQAQFEQGELTGVVASTSDSVVVSGEIGEYGTAVVTNNNWLTINTLRSYTDMVVVASAEFDGSSHGNSRTPRIRNKTTDSFEIKVDDYTDGFTGSTIVDYIVMEAGDWTIADGGSGTRVLAGTEADVSDVQIDTYNDTTGVTINFSPAFSTPPVVLATVSSNNDSNWIATHVDGGSTRDGEVTASTMRLALAVSRHTTSAHSGPEDIDYIVMAPQNNGTNNSVQFEAFNSNDAVDDVPTNGGYSQTFPTAFASAPAVTVVHNNAEDGGNGGFALKDTSGTQNGTSIFMSILEDGASADQHTQEVVSVIAFQNSSGLIDRHNTGALSGTIAGEDIIFSDGAGPKFDNFSWSSTTAGTSDLTVQIQYRVSEGVYALVPDSQIPGNSSGINSGLIDLTSVDINTYPVIRAYATLTCGGGGCPTLDDWQLEWGEGVNMSGTIKEYDRITNVTSGTVRAAVNGSLVAGTGSISAGTWTMSNVTAFAGDIVTVWVDGAAEANEAVAAFVYDGTGDITGVEMFEQHLSISADENGTTTNALLGLNDSTAIGDEDIFYQVDGFNNLTVCGQGTCTDANLYVGSGNIYIPNSAGGVVTNTHDFVNDGFIELDSNTFNISGSWYNNATSSNDTSTINLTASTGTETIVSSEDPLAFHNLSFGSGAGGATFTIAADLDLSGNLTVASGTLARDGYDFTVAGNITNGTGGYWSGTGTTTFDGSGSKTWTDNNPATQNIGNVVVDGASTFLTVTTDVAAYDVVIGANDTLAGGNNTIYVGGDWVNAGTFNAESSTVEVTVDDRTYPPIIPGSADWYADTAFTDRIPVVIQDSEVPGTLTNFPVYVDLSHLGDDFWSDVQSDGDDIRITRSDGQTELPYEIVSFDPTNKTGELHFLANSISGTATTTFYLYYNNPSASGYLVSGTYGRNAVWSEYTAVYHMHDDPTTIGNQVTDATGNGYDLLVETEALATSTGQLGYGISLVGVSGLLRASDFQWTTGSPLTTSGWYKMPAASGEAIWQFGTGADPDQLFFRPWYATNNGEFDFGNTTGDTYTFSPRDTSNWNHFFTLGATSTSDFNYVYHDNILRESQAQTVANPGNTNGTGLQIGRQGTTGSLEAEIDELRFAALLRDTDWMTAEYNNQYTPQNFYATSSIESYVADLVIDEATHNITAGGSAFNHITFDDATTTPAFTEASVVVNGDFTVATGTVTLPNSKLTVGGSFINNSYFMHNNAEVEFISNGAATITLNGTQFFNALYDVTFDGSGTFTFTDANATTSGDLIIDDGTVVFPSGTLSIGGTLQNTGGSFNANGGLVVFASLENESVMTGGSSFADVSFGQSGVSAGWYDPAWDNRIYIQIASTSVPGALSNFPVYVDLGSLGATFWSAVASDGADIRVTTADGSTEVPVEVVEIDPGTKTGELHFLAPLLSGIADTSFYLYFGNTSAELPAANSVYGSENVWVGYEAVYHFNEDPTFGVTDVTGNGKDLAPTVGTPSTTAGLLGVALDTTATNVMMEDSDWAWQSGDDLISSGLYFQNNFDTGALWEFGTSCATDDCLAFRPWYDNATRGYHNFGETTGTDYNFTRDNSVWHHFTTIGRAANGESVEIYEDAVQRDVYTQSGSGENPSQTGLQIGRFTTNTYMDIDIDELRFATTVPSSVWIETEYNNLTDVANFYSTSSQAYLEVVPSFTLSESITDVNGDVSIYFSNLVAPSNNFTIGGSAQNTGGSYDPNNATTTFDSNDTGETFDFGDVSFYNLAFDGVGGGWTVSTTTVLANLTLANGASYTQATNTTMAVGGIFSNQFAAAATDWTQSTLALSGGDYTVTGRLDSGDSYATVIVLGDTDIVIWNSSIATTSVRDTSSIYLPDYNNSDGVLRIYGDYIRTSGSEYWSYATDFDGTDLTGGGERQVTVQLGHGASVQMATGTTLGVIGASGATTSVSAISGIYSLSVNAGTVAVDYASFQNTGKIGLALTGGTSVSTLTRAAFSVAGGRSGITVDADTVNAQPSSEFGSVYFATSSANSIYEPAWNDQVVVTVPSGVVSETMTEFPLYVDLSTLGAGFWAGVQSDGRDIRVTTDAGVELPIDLVEIDSAAQTGELHFLAPELSTVNDTAFYIHFDNPAATAYGADDEYGANAVWVNYEAVYHFDEDPSIQITDMTGNERNLFPTVGAAATTSGQIGTAIDMTAGNVTLQSIGWTWPAGQDLISSGLYFQSAADTGALWEFGTSCVADTCIAFLPWYTGTTGYNRFGELTGSDYAFARNNTIWHHFTTIGRSADTESVDIYEDNILRDTYPQTASGENPSQTGLQIGRYTGGTYMDIDIDELRFTTSEPSTARIDAEYNNLLTPSAFYATSAAQTFQYNVSVDGVPSTFWLFSNGSGNLYGEAFDNDDGDPGSIQWDDSNFAITISGIVFQDDGVTPETYPVCNGSTEVVTVVLDGTDTYTAPCDPFDGSYAVTGITYTGEPEIVTYLESSAATPQVNVSIYDETTGTGTVGGGVMTVSRPSVVDGSVLVLIAGKDDDPTITEPAGWTAIDTLGNTTGDQIDTGAWYRVVADASTEPATYDFTADNGEGFSYWMGSLINVDTSTPIDVASTWTKLQNQYAAVSPEVTTVTNGALVLSAWYTYRDTETVPPVYAWESRADNLVGPETNNLSVASLAMPTAGATGDATTTGIIASRETHVGQFVFRPAASPTGSSSAIAAAVTKTPLGNSGSPYGVVMLRDQANDYGTVAAAADIVVPSPHVENGDVLVVVIGKEDDFNITAPSGWVLGSERIEATGNDMYTAIWYHVVTNAGLEPSTYNFTSNDTSVEEYSYWIGSFDGVDTTSIFDVSPSWSNLQNDSSPTAPAVTTVTDGAYVLAAWYVIDDSNLDMPGTPWDTLVQDAVTNNRLLALAGRSMPSYGNTGAAVITGGSTDDVNTGQFALRPAAISVPSEIADMDLYENRVIVRHEDSAPLTIADMVIFDNSDDVDLPFSATAGSPDDLAILPGSGLYVWNNKEFAPYGTIDLQGNGTTTADGSLAIGAGATFTSSSTHSITIGGSFHGETGATFTGASSLVTFTSTSTGQTITSSASSTFTFYDLAFTGTGGEWRVLTPITAQTDILVADGTLSGIANVTVTNGSLYGDGLVDMTGGTTRINNTNTLGGSNEWNFYNLTLGSGSVAGVTTRASNATTTVRNILTISTAHFLDAFGSVWDIQGNGNTFVESGTFLEGTSTIRYSGATPNVLRTTYRNLVIDTESGGSVTAAAPSTGLQVLGNLTVGALGTSTLNLNTNDPVTAVGGSVHIGTLGSLLGSNSALLTVLGNWDNDGTFTANGGTVQFSKSGGSASVAAGGSSFANVNVLGTATYTFTESATATASFTLNTGSFTLASGEALAVGGSFTNSMSDTNTTWTNTTLSLYSGTAYVINSKSTGDAYENVVVSNNTHPRFWNSTTTAVTTAAGSSLYSMDHQGVDGYLYIYGDLMSDTYDDHWSYATDFDGTALGGSSRQAVVEIESGGSVLYTSGSLSVIGADTASTTISATSGTYEMTLAGDTDVVMNYYVVRDTTSDGLIFTGVPNVSDLSYGDFEVAIAGGSTMTVGGMVIDVNPAQEYNYISMATTTAISAFNVTATGTSASAWRYVNIYGNLGGEAKDVDPGGDPGYITWQDSAAIINISGTVYSDEGSSPMGATVCDSSTNSIRLSVNGSTFYDTTCAIGTGVYSFTGVSYGLGNTLTVYINGEAEKATTITQDPISSINNFDLYEDRVIIKHEAAAPMTVADMGTWDSDDDPDVLFDVETAGGDSLTLPSDTKLIVWNNKQFDPNGDVTISGGGAGGAHDGTFELRTGATFSGGSGEVYTIGGSLISGSSAVFNPGQSTTTFTTSGAARTIDTNESGFYNLELNGSGSWTVSDTNLSVAGDYVQSTGSITLPAATTTIGGSFTVSGGTFDANSGVLAFTASDAGNDVSFNGSDAATVFFAGAGSWSMSDVRATTTADFIVANGTVTLPGGTITVDGNFVVLDTVLHNNGLVKLIDTAGSSILTLSGSDLYSVDVQAGGGDYTLSDASAALLGDLTITSGTFTAGAGTLSVAGSFDTSAAVFAHNNGTVLFNSSDTGETVDLGDNALYNATFGSLAGGWTVLSNATTTRNFALTGATSFTMSSGTRLYVGGVFTNLVGGSATDWQGTRIVLDGANEYEIGGKLISTEQYNILEIGANSDISTWNTAATATVVAATASWYSQDHAGTDGALNIYGDYHIATTTEYWNYSTDFDGTALGGSSRQAMVSIAGGAAVTLDGGVLNMLGGSGATTSVTNQGSGTYTFSATDGILNADTYSFRNLDAAGLQLLGTLMITSLDDGDFEQAANGGTLITLASTTLDTNASLLITDTRFATGGFTPGANVTLDATTTNSWSFTGSLGDLWGEAYDVDGSDDCSSVRWDDSQCLLTEQTTYRWRNDDGGEGAVSSTWFNTSWSKRQRVRVINSDATPYTDVAVKLTVPYDADMQTDFDDLRFTDASGTTSIEYWKERYNTGSEATVWIKVPTLAADAVTEIYMYYGNVSATSSSDASNTFDVYDDFEDNDISEYSGDTHLFNTAGTFAYGGGYGLDTAGNESAKATDGIARTDVTVSQGQIIRYMQYVDTTAGSGDEVCTMFAVQSPVTNNNNYAVCLEQFGTDRISLVKDVQNTDSTGTLLDTANATFSTGWYEVEIDWQTDDTIDVALYTAAGSLVATTSATDSTYSSGGIGFTFWFQNGGWDSVVAWPRTDSVPVVYFGDEQVTGGATWAAAQDTALSGLAFNETARLRIGIENTGLDIENQNFRLEFAPRLAAPSCQAVSGGSFTAVPVAASCGTSAICMTTSASTTNGDPTTDHLVTAAGDFVAGEIVANTSNQTSNLDLIQNRYTEVEYAIALTVNATNDAYCFRVTDGGATLDSYAKLPELTLAFDPSLDTVSLNSGLDITLTPGATTTVVASTTVTDLNGVADLYLATTTFYKTSVGASCTPDNNDCYVATSTCSFSSCTATTCTLSCSADFQFHADPTDNDGGEEWFAFMEVSDLGGGVDFDTSIGVELLTLRALEVQSAINYGTVDINQNTGAFNPSVSLLNLGNEAIDVEIAGTDMTDGVASIIPAAQQLYATSTFNYESCTSCSALSVVGSDLEVDLNKPLVDSPLISDDVYWGVEVPFGVASNPHSGVNTFTAISD
ncbi:MAG: DUF2341 domain-containing protein [Candidatus Kaiserbacteria bacterium]|nr:DUF2341 domain-containing protein [Candidatus Kaiserbacteria bacterium]